MARKQSYTFDRQSAKRIADTVRRSEADLPGDRGEPGFVAAPKILRFARIASHNGSGVYTATEVYYHDNSSATHFPQPFSDKTAQSFTTVRELNGYGRVAAGTVVPVFRLRGTTDTSGATGVFSTDFVFVRGVEAYPALFPVTLTQTGGVSGDASTQCSFTYTVKDVTGTVELGTGMSPAFARPALGKMVAGTKGVAYYATEDTLVLHQTDEVPAVAVCT